MKKPATSFVGYWRITEMEVWDADYFDMEVPAYISIREDSTGEFQFGLVQAELDGRIDTVDGDSRFEFTWFGFDENDPVSGRGWLSAKGNQVEGRIFIHQGDDSGLNAVRKV